MHVKCTLGVYDAYGAWLGGGAWDAGGSVTEGMLAAAGDAVSLGITMLGVMAFWTGILEIGRRAGLIEQLSAGYTAGASFPLSTHSSGSSSAFFDGRQYDCQYAGAWLGGDPGGLTAMKELEELEEERRAAGGIRRRSHRERRAMKCVRFWS